MKKVLLVGVFFLGGCTLTERIDNPVTLERQYQVEAAVVMVRRPAVAYFDLRQCKKNEEPSLKNLCGKRSVKVKIQEYDKKLQASLLAFRDFVKNNPTLDPVSASLAVYSAIGEYRENLEILGVQSWTSLP